MIHPFIWSAFAQNIPIALAIIMHHIDWGSYTTSYPSSEKYLICTVLEMDFDQNSIRHSPAAHRSVVSEVYSGYFT